jgi:regulator of protease activity HflC (stomatin/prohibitin superfamily)
MTRHPKPEQPPILPPGPGGNERSDVARQSLAGALRMSFRLLSIIMIAVVVALFLTGLQQIDQNERGIRLLLGRIQGEGDGRVLSPGLNWSLPEPLGNVEKVSTNARTMRIEEFWLHEPAGESTIPLEKRQPPRGGGLKPLINGTLLTADRALLHCRLTVEFYYGVSGDNPRPEKVLAYFKGMANPEEAIRSAVCSAAIRAAAERTAEVILTSEQEAFREDIKSFAQRRLNDVNAGVQIRQVTLTDLTVPLGAIAAYNRTSEARSQREEKVNQARKDASDILERTAGAAWRKLVAPPWTEGDKAPEPGLLQQYGLARERGDGEAAAELLAEIDAILTSGEPAGEVARVINRADSYSSRIRKTVQSRVDEFAKLLPIYRRTPQLLMAMVWADVAEEILKSPTNTKHILAAGEKIVLRLSEDPDLRREAEEARLRDQDDR